jgi:hypothetical protein
MIKKTFLSTIPFILILLGGCASAPNQQQMANADYGSPQTPAQCLTAVEEKVKYVMKDPSSVQWQHNSCIKGYWSSVPIMGLPIAYGYFQSGSINAKNSYGGYVGFKPYQALIRNGRVVRYCVQDNDGMCVPKTN